MVAQVAPVSIEGEFEEHKAYTGTAALKHFGPMTRFVACFNDIRAPSVVVRKWTEAHTHDMTTTSAAALCSHGLHMAAGPNTGAPYETPHGGYKWLATGRRSVMGRATHRQYPSISLI